MPDLGVPELLIILFIVVLLFGSKKLPEMSRSVGRSLRIFKAETKGLNDDEASAAAQPTAAAPQVAPPAAVPPGVAPAPAVTVAPVVESQAAAVAAPAPVPASGGTAPADGAR